MTPETDGVGRLAACSKVTEPRKPDAGGAKTAMYEEYGSDAETGSRHSREQLQRAVGTLNEGAGYEDGERVGFGRLGPRDRKWPHLAPVEGGLLCVVQLCGCEEDNGMRSGQEVGLRLRGMMTAIMGDGVGRGNGDGDSPAVQWDTIPITQSLPNREACSSGLPEGYHSTQNSATGAQDTADYNAECRLGSRVNDSNTTLA